jgi:hypothetical protein
MTSTVSQANRRLVLMSEVLQRGVIRSSRHLHSPSSHITDAVVEQALAMMTASPNTTQQGTPQEDDPLTPADATAVATVPAHVFDTLHHEIIGLRKVYSPISSGISAPSCAQTDGGHHWRAVGVSCVRQRMPDGGGELAAKTTARLVFEVSGGLASPSSRGLWRRSSSLLFFHRNPDTLGTRRS